MTEQELPIIQRSYDLLLWLIPRVNAFPRDYRFVLGDRIEARLLDILEKLIRARYRRDKLGLLEEINADLDVVRYLIRMCRDLGLLDVRRYEYATGGINEIGESLGGWIRQQRKQQ
ncbi:MAG: diversity-generating retroelement protein Avd [Candidatus Hydrogenedentes bacterium]|nr:diversity-generating retroelement protein Avd [Candidatus Hydrogenedentota bacterium]